MMASKMGVAQAHVQLGWQFGLEMGKAIAVTSKEYARCAPQRKVPRPRDHSTPSAFNFSPKRPQSRRQHREVIRIISVSAHALACSPVQFGLAKPTAVKLATPNPVSNADMMGIFRRQCRMPIGLPAARWMLEVGTFLMRTESELVIKSRRVVPGRLLAAGFQFRFPDLESTLADLLRPAT
jgi:hypothetical protein